MKIMTEQQRKGIEILNDLKAQKNDEGFPVISDDDYFYLLSFIIDKPQEVMPVTWPWQPQPITPIFGQRWEITCKSDLNQTGEEL